jgi:hypothetical protein
MKKTRQCLKLFKSAIKIRSFLPISESKFEGVSKSFRTGCLEQELQMV